jgi:hypothetical protein
MKMNKGSLLDGYNDESCEYHSICLGDSDDLQLSGTFPVVGMLTFLV